LIQGLNFTVVELSVTVAGCLLQVAPLSWVTNTWKAVPVVFNTATVKVPVWAGSAATKVESIPTLAGAGTA
jgi:hypothetical protein